MLSLIKVITLAMASTLISATPVANKGSANIEARQTSCTDIQVFFARGAAEPGTLGTIAGPPFASALRSALPNKNVGFDGLEYSPQFFFGDNDYSSASTKMAQLINVYAARCPFTRLVMSGYDIGARVVHEAAPLINDNFQRNFAAVITFGDPKQTTQLPGLFQERYQSFCNAGDLICAGGFFPVTTPEHLAYASIAVAAATYVASRYY